VRQALSSLAAQAGISVTLDPRVQGLANAVIDDQPFDRALHSILLPLGLTYLRQDDGSYLIGAPDPSSPLFPLLSSRVHFQARHLSPQELTELLPVRLVGFVRMDERHNSLIVEAPPALTRHILWELEQIDQPVPQVVLEAIVCVLAPESQFRFGLDFDGGFEIGDDDFMRLA